MTFDLSATRFSKSNALYCAAACQAIYLPALNPEFSVTDGGDHILVCFRGSKTAKDWITDARSWPLKVEPVAGESGMRIHAGFWSEFQAIRKDLDLAISTAQGVTPLRPLVISGHSLGAALASLYARFCPFPVASVYTFGQPRTGNKVYAESYNNLCTDTANRPLKIGPLREKTYRVVAKLDIVPRVPFIGYWHHDNEVLLTGNGYRVDPSCWQRMTTDCWLEWRGFVKRKLANVDEALQDHHMETSYIPLLESLK